MNDDKHKFIPEMPVEADMERLSKEAKEVQKLPEYQNANPKEVIRRSLQSMSGGNQAVNDQAQKNDDNPSPINDDPLLPDELPQIRGPELLFERLFVAGAQVGVGHFDVVAPARARCKPCGIRRLRKEGRSNRSVGRL